MKGNVRCPRCHRRHEVYVSRLSSKKSTLKRWIFNYYICEVCEFRFREGKSVLGVLVFAGFVALVAFSIWFAWRILA